MCIMLTLYTILFGVRLVKKSKNVKINDKITNPIIICYKL